MRNRLIALVLVAGIGAPVLAQAQVAPMPRCEAASLSAEEANFEGYDYTLTGDGFAYYERRHIGGDRWEFIVEHCPTRERLQVALEGRGVTGDQQRINDLLAPILEAIQGPTAHTLQDLRAIALTAGGGARLAVADESSCVCRMWGDE